MKTRDRYIFLLGGHDLEMVEIRKLLEQAGYREDVHFFDKKLSWGASLSAYEEYLEMDAHIVGIELVEEQGMKLPENYIRIDHHNKESDLPAAIEQLASLLGIELSREQMLVAANDKGYIPAMIAMGATQQEIDHIRRKDREAQGATEEDERLAELSIRASTYQGEIKIIQSQTKKFSTITDRLFGKIERILVYTDEEFTYYGTEEDKHLLIKVFETEIAAGKMYYGGQKGGFIGASAGEFSPENLTHLRNKLIDSLKKA